MLPLGWLGAVAVALSLLAPASVANASIFAYVTNAVGGGHPGNLSQYDASNGELVALSPPIADAVKSPIGVAVSPDRSNVYATATPYGPGAGSLLQYAIGPGGALSLKSAAPMPTDALPQALVVSPDGKSVYAANDGGAGSVIQYSVDADGGLSPMSPATVPTGPAPARMAITPDGRSLYVTSAIDAPDGTTVWQYSVGDDGTLSAKSPPSIPTTLAALGIAVSPDGRSVYLAENDPLFGKGGSVAQYTVEADGALTPKSPPAVPAPGDPFEVVVRPDGNSVYVSNSANSEPTGSVLQYAVDESGALTPMSPSAVPAGSGPLGIAVHPDGNSVYVVDAGSNAVSQYSVAPDGALSSATPATVPTGASPVEIAVRSLAATITSGPSGITADATPTFRFSAFAPHTTFRCKVDATAYRACSSPDTLARQADGKHTFSVRTTTDSTPDRRTFKVATPPPAPGWEGFVTNRASGCSGRVQMPFLDGVSRVAANTEIFCPKQTQLTIRSRLQADYAFADLTMDQRGCVNKPGCVRSVPRGFSYYHLACPKSGSRRHNTGYYTDLVFYPGDRAGKATSTRSRDATLSPYCLW